MSYVTGSTMKQLREKRKLTQKELAYSIAVSDKTISKWETGKGLPDVAILEDLAQALGISVSELLTGDLKENENPAGNMKKILFYVCPVCGNIITAVGSGTYSCCGITLPELEAEPCDDDHMIEVETIDQEYYVTVKHPMEKTHYLSFLSYVTSDTMEMVKLYPEQDVSIRLRKKGHGMLYAFCNRHGMFQMRI